MYGKCDLKPPALPAFQLWPKSEFVPFGWFQAVFYFSQIPPRNCRASIRTAASLIPEWDLGGGFAKLPARNWGIKRDSWGSENGTIHRRRRPRRIAPQNPKLIVFHQNQVSRCGSILAIFYETAAYDYFS